MTTVTGLTKARMLLIEAKSIVSGVIQGDNLVLTRNDGTPMVAGNVRGPKGDTGATGSISNSPAGGDLAGNYPNPTVAAKDDEPGIPSMRTLGTGSKQAAAGNHSHAGLTDLGWVSFTPTAGESPFSGIAAVYAQYRKVGQLVHLRVAKTLSVAADRTAYTSGDFPNVRILGINSIPVAIRPTFAVSGAANIASSNATVNALPTGDITWYGGMPRLYGAGLQFSADFVYMTNN